MRTRQSLRNQNRLYKAIGRDLSTTAMRERLFAGCYPCGIVYADKSIEEHGDYKRIAFLQYSTLELQIDAPKSPLLPLVKSDAAAIQAKRGESFQIAGNMSVILGSTMLA